MSIQRVLLSRITDDTPISGFYGPGTWWGFLVTLGMTHGHAAVSVLIDGEMSSDWDYDLIGAAGFLMAATVDLIVKSRTIADLGDEANQSNLIPALICAERVVAVGTGSFVFSVLFAVIFGDSEGARLRTAVVAGIPLTLSFIASFFSLHAHQVMAHTAPVIWCALHDGSKLEKHIPFTLVDFPAVVGEVALVIPKLFIQPWYWYITAAASGIAMSVSLIRSLVWSRHLKRLLRTAAMAPLTTAGAFIGFPVCAMGFIAGIATLKWLCLWVAAWWPVYILAFFPQMGYFPLTKISIFEMDQMAALIFLVVVAGIRTFRRIIEWYN
ncbi:hypothetical protein R3P38DRAFT_3214339 [Favolaschia claudopus]|uniref:Uncharacterized protein n=1 Tax=Favolaschia claudopus TaxID=2862362 RepID=A0AAW0AAU5_9AGAR